MKNDLKRFFGVKMDIDKALKILDKEVTHYANRDNGIEYNSTLMLVALETVNSWVQAVKDKFNAPMKDEY